MKKTLLNIAQTVLIVLAFIAIIIARLHIPDFYSFRYFNPQPFETDTQTEFKYKQDNKGNREAKISVKIKDETVYITTEKTLILENDDVIHLFSGNSSLTLKNALKYGIVYKSVRRYEVDENKLLTYCLFD